MNNNCSQFTLTAQERNQFETEGYFIVEDALSTEHVNQLIQSVDRIFEQKASEGLEPGKALFHANFIPDDALFVNLVDYERILPKVWDLLGWNIFLYHAHMIVTPPTGQPQNDKTFGWHQDSGRVNIEIESNPRPRLSLKVAYFLSDLSTAGRGNFWVVPGSHLKDTLTIPQGEGQIAGAIPITIKPGTAVFFDRRLWHAGSPNWSDITRKVLFYGYSYRWLRTKDEMTVQSLWPESDPIRRQLLGYGTSSNGFYSPTDEDVPLRVWLRENFPESAK